MFMEDEKGLDSKVVLSRTGENERPPQPSAFSRVPGWVLLVWLAALDDFRNWLIREAA